MARKNRCIHLNTTSRKTKSKLSDDAFLIENGFRGFKKTPVVLLERTDLTPFLKNNRFENNHNRSETNDLQKQHLNKLLLKVSVVLVRADLDKLKRELNKTSNLNDNMNPKSNTKLSRLKRNSETITTDEIQPQKTQERTKAAFTRNRDLKLIKGGIIQMETDSNLKQFVTKKNDFSQLPSDLTNEEESNNITLAKMSIDYSKYLYVLVKKSTYENSTNNLSINNSTKQLYQFQNDQNYSGKDAIDFDILPKKAIVDTKSRKTIISRYHCEICGKYLSTNFGLTRHKMLKHAVKKKLGCALCGEMFAREFLLKSHRCPCKKQLLDDPKPVKPCAINNMANVLDGDKVNGVNNKDYGVTLPVIKLNEYYSNEQLVSSANNMTHVMPLQNKRYNLVLREVPIEF